MVTLTSGIMFVFTYMHFWAWGILRRWSVCAPTAYEVVPACRKLDKHRIRKQIYVSSCHIILRYDPVVLDWSDMRGWRSPGWELNQESPVSRIRQKRLFGLCKGRKSPSHLRNNLQCAVGRQAVLSIHSLDSRRIWLGKTAYRQECR
jgi:hypothetical protein